MSIPSIKNVVSSEKLLKQLENDPLVGALLLPGQLKVLFDAADQVPDGGLIVEIGSYLGASTIALALACIGTSKRVIAIDTFKGNQTDFQKGKFKLIGLVRHTKIYLIII